VLAVARTETTQPPRELGSSLNEQSREDATRPFLIYDKVFWAFGFQSIKDLMRFESLNQHARNGAKIRAARMTSTAATG
jgi:hypothetical protein